MQSSWWLLKILASDFSAKTGIANYFEQAEEDEARLSE